MVRVIWVDWGCDLPVGSGAGFGGIRDSSGLFRRAVGAGMVGGFMCGDGEE